MLICCIIKDNSRCYIWEDKYLSIYAQHVHLWQSAPVLELRHSLCLDLLMVDPIIHNEFSKLNSFTRYLLLLGANMYPFTHNDDLLNMFLKCSFMYIYKCLYLVSQCGYNIYLTWSCFNVTVYFNTYIILTNTHAHTHSRTHAHTHTRTHTRTHSLTHTRTHSHYTYSHTYQHEYECMYVLIHHILIVYTCWLLNVSNLVS